MNQRRNEKLQNVKDCEAAGEVADSLDVRIKLIEQMNAGELTFDQVQAELKRIKRNASKSGKITRAQAFRNG